MNPRQVGTNVLAGTEAGAEHSATQRATAMRLLSHCGLALCGACGDAVWLLEADPDRPGRHVSRRCRQCPTLPVNVAERINRYAHLLESDQWADSPYYGALLAEAAGLGLEVGAWLPGLELPP